MNKSICITLLLLLGLALVPEMAPDMAIADTERSSALPHAPLTRLDFVAAKSLAGISLGEKGGELGDAAVTSDRYDMLRMALDLRIDPADKSIAGTVQMVFRSGDDGLEQFVFDLIANLTVDSISHQSGALVFSHLADSVAVTLPVLLAGGEVDSLVVHYSGIPQSPIYNRGLMFKQHFPVESVDQSLLVPIVASLSQPAYAQSWWPCKDRPDDKFRMTMNLMVPENLVGVSNGTWLGAETVAGWTTSHWSEAHPIASYLVSVAISDYVVLESDCLTANGANVPLKNWVYPAYEDAAAIDFAPLCDMINFCETRFGPYPFVGEKYGHAQFVWPGAMEHQTVTSVGAGSLGGDGSHAWLIVHELGHQWFGDSLTPADWADIWLNEGFATYTEALWFEHTEGKPAYDVYMAEARNENEWLREGSVYDPFPIFPGRVIYDKGAWILHILRNRMGDEAFFALIADWTSGVDRALGHVETQEFIELAGVWAGEDLNDFLWPYLTSTELPEVSFDYGLSTGNAGPDTHLKVSLVQRQITLFDNRFPIVVTTAPAQKNTVWVDLNSVSASAEFEFAAEILSVELDPEQTVLWRAQGTASQGAGLTVAFPNPATENYIVFRYWLENSANLNVRIFDVMGREVAARQLGRESFGLHEWGWDLTGDGGARMPSGVYWAALYVDGARSVLPFTIIR